MQNLLQPHIDLVAAVAINVVDGIGVAVLREFKSRTRYSRNFTKRKAIPSRMALIYSGMNPYS